MPRPRITPVRLTVPVNFPEERPHTRSLAYRVGPGGINDFVTPKYVKCRSCGQGASINPKLYKKGNPFVCGACRAKETE